MGRFITEVFDRAAAFLLGRSIVGDLRRSLAEDRGSGGPGGNGLESTAEVRGLEDLAGGEVEQQSPGQGRGSGGREVETNLPGELKYTGAPG